MSTKISQRGARLLKHRIAFLESMIRSGDAVVERFALSRFAEVGDRVLREVGVARALNFRVEASISGDMLCLHGVRRREAKL